VAFPSGAALRRARNPRPAPPRGVASQLRTGRALRRTRALVASCPSSPLAGTGDERNPHANGGILLRDLGSPTSATTRSTSRSPGPAQPRRPASGIVPAGRDRPEPENFRLFARTRRPRTGSGGIRGGAEGLGGHDRATDEYLARRGAPWRCFPSISARAGWRATCSRAATGVFNCYEAFIHIVDSMFNQHAKWLKVTRGIPWRRPIASLNYLLSSHVWRAGSQRALAPGSGLHRPRREQEGGDHPRLPATRMRTRCSRSPITACAA